MTCNDKIIIHWNLIMLITLKEQLKLLISNPVFLSGVVSCLAAQFIKTLINLAGAKVHSARELIELLFWRTGGMPSSHSSLVAALCTSIAFSDGLDSNTFLISFVLLLIVVRDAFGVRRSSGVQAQKLNELGKELSNKKIINEYKSLKEVNGHTPMQVILGCLLGFLIGLAFSLLK